MEHLPVHDIVRYLRDRLPDMVALLQQLVVQETPSTVPESQRPVLTLLADFLALCNYRSRFIPGRQTGGHLFAQPRQRVRQQPAQLLLGHCDTVWPLGTLKEMPWEVGEGIIRGPGVYDMKAGLVQVLSALHALQALGLTPSVTPLVFINSDEEIGSRESTPHIRRLAQCANRVFVFEPSLGLAGDLKIARKGVGRFTVVAKGKAAHAGLDPDGGASAILELSFVIQKLFALNDANKGITVNVGMIDGGLRPNVIAPESRASIDVRVLTHEDAQHIEKSIHSLQATTPGVTLEITGQIGRQPMEQTPRNLALLEVAKEAGRSMQVNIGAGVAGGASDGNTTSLFTATLDGLGAVGDGAHARHEFIYFDKMVERSALLALLLMTPSLRT
ncbi:MAG: M20 family metallopeptidase [Candidatus Binatia bacterium]